MNDDWIFVYNNGKANHGRTISKLLEKADRLDCAIAFVKLSGLNSIRQALERRLRVGMNARFLVSLDFWLTEPAALRMLFQFQSRFDLQIFVKPSGGSTFHPKVLSL